MPEIYLNCDKCQGSMLHFMSWEGDEYWVTCANCHDEAPLKDKAKPHVQMMTATKVKQERV